MGQGIMPQGYDPLVDAAPEAEIEHALAQMHAMVKATAEAMPRHGDFIQQTCPARPEPASM